MQIRQAVMSSTRQSNVYIDDILEEGCERVCEMSEIIDMGKFVCDFISVSKQK